MTRHLFNPSPMDDMIRPNHAGFSYVARGDTPKSTFWFNPKKVSTQKNDLDSIFSNTISTGGYDSTVSASGSLVTIKGFRPAFKIPTAQTVDLPNKKATYPYQLNYFQDPYVAISFDSFQKM